MTYIMYKTSDKVNEWINKNKRFIAGIVNQPLSGEKCYHEFIEHILRIAGQPDKKIWVCKKCGFQSKK